MDKPVSNLLNEEKEVFDFNIMLIYKDLNKCLTNLINLVNEHVLDEKTKDSLLLKLNDKVVLLNTLFIDEIHKKRKQIMEYFITNRQVYSTKIEDDKDIENIINMIDLSSLWNRQKEEFVLKLNNCNDLLIKKMKKDVYKLFDSLINYLKDVSLEDNIEELNVFIINHTYKTIYMELMNVLKIEEDNIQIISSQYKNEIIESLNSIVPIDKRKEIAKYLDDKYINIVNTMYNKYITYILDKIYTIITTNKKYSIDNIEEPFLELAKKNSIPKYMDSVKLIEPIIKNIVIKIYGTYVEKEYMDIYFLINDYMNKLNEVLLEKIELVPNIIIDIVLREKNDTITLLEETKNLSSLEVIEKFKKQEAIDKNLSSNKFRI